MLHTKDTSGEVFETCIAGLVEALIVQSRYEEELSLASRADAREALE